MIFISKILVWLLSITILITCLLWIYIQVYRYKAQKHAKKGMKTTSILRSGIEMTDVIHARVKTAIRRGDTTTVNYELLLWYRHLLPSTTRQIFKFVPQPDTELKSATAAYNWVHCSND